MKSVYKRTVPSGTDPWDSFTSVAEYPQTCKSAITCAGFTSALAKNKEISIDAMNYVNAFKWIDGVCTAGKITKDYLFDWPNGEVIGNPGIYLHQGCYIDQKPKNISSSILFLNDLFIYYPAYGDSSYAYYSSSLTETSDFYDWALVPHYGHTFINGRRSLYRGPGERYIVSKL